MRGVMPSPLSKVFGYHHEQKAHKKASPQEIEAKKKSILGVDTEYRSY